MGKYIVCGEAHSQGYVIQANCFETVIDRLDNNSKTFALRTCFTFQCCLVGWWASSASPSSASSL